ncbi:outer membrane lipid asymmetry maintenance protein MlaD [Salinisphaera sp. Q1T1-3]|uniref:outer membrane lipid asymmetry maintenance protein MlaD n=1 Tax=Salinisphaera sp. Q1T1-3 TaxID=2321229 RepID=UPI000E759208|nr:outer membrane lipid asymmetry maintenance protein MlaD [Salinisphaera sp. Q1T1-3]RJS94635.1 outer membrane lipid asymmetry maintenance protein MlaD [Salinisphaera sp. Q1T1-3]
MQSRAVEMLVGLFVCLGIAAIFILTYRVSDLADRSDASGYTVTAAFNDIGGLKVGAPVDLAGVRIGRVTDIKLDQTTYRAVATMRIADQYKIPSDSDASILTSGLLGDQYIGVGPGGAPDNMKNGDKFMLTQSAIVLENLIGQFMTSFAGGSSDDDAGSGQHGSSDNQNSQKNSQNGSGNDMFAPPASSGQDTGGASSRP